LVFVAEAPLFGHGLGCTKPLYQSLEATKPSPYGEVTPDPHNQFFAITIQAGLIGGALLLALWTSHFGMFVGQREFAVLLGQALVIQNVLGSLFNSHLTTVTQGMMYCLGVGLLGAATWKSGPLSCHGNLCEADPSDRSNSSGSTSTPSSSLATPSRFAHQ